MTVIPCSNCGHLEQSDSRFDPIPSRTGNAQQQLEDLESEIARIEAYLEAGQPYEKKKPLEATH